MNGHFVGVMNTSKKTLRQECISRVFSPHQEEDSEEEPKLKYERLSNGVTEILQKDAASCMTVHDKVEVIIRQPQGHSNLESTRLKYRFHIVYVDIQEMSSSKLLGFFFYPPCAVSKGGPFFSHLPLLCLSGRHIKKEPDAIVLFFLFPLLHIPSLLASVCLVLIFLREAHSRRDG